MTIQKNYVEISTCCIQIYMLRVPDPDPDPDSVQLLHQNIIDYSTMKCVLLVIWSMCCHHKSKYALFPLGNGTNTKCANAGKETKV
jgi:hypothetical protein